MKPISNVSIYGLEESVRASKYPMSTDLHSLSYDITPRVCSLGSAAAGSGHDQYLTGIIAQFDLTFSIKAWTEAQRYHFLDFVSSQSTMHRITEFDTKKSYNRHVDSRVIEIMREKISVYKRMKEDGACEDELRELYLDILYTNPAGFQLTARMTTNYRQLKTIYHQRKNHRLPEWRAFCKQIESFPHFMDLCMGGEKDGKQNA